MEPKRFEWASNSLFLWNISHALDCGISLVDCYSLGHYSLRIELCCSQGEKGRRTFKLKTILYKGYDENSKVLWETPYQEFAEARRATLSNYYDEITDKVDMLLAADIACEALTYIHFDKSQRAQLLEIIEAGKAVK